ncbi:MAG: endonuclease MutS2 [Deltaproteobacteria bacterium]|nr:endonuclease MutS2 [Deltaproteobacteria bacterium]
MIKHTYHVLEFHKLLHILSGYASCPLGRSDCLSLKPLSDLKVIDNEQRLVSEMKLLLNVKGFFPFEGLIDTGHILKDCRVEGSCLEPEQFISVLRITEESKQSKKNILSQQDLCPGLYDMVKEMPLCEELREAIKKAIHPNGSISDSASPGLKKIRRKKRDLRGALQKRLENIKRSLSIASDGDDHLISIRDGRYVIPLRTNLKNRVQGIIHGYSQTHATCFFEPIEAMEENNRLAELSHLEKGEELRILSCLSAMARDVAEDLHRAQTLLGRLDGIFARAQFSTALNGVRPIMRHNSVIDLRQARNPILISMAHEGDSPVPVDILLDRDVNIMIISGPNRGGKTVTLKTLGLLSLMAQAGIHIPVAEGSRLPVFRNILAEIGDDQDIQTGLSTFSAHVSHLKDMMECADQESLILIDEPGMGTDPDEGAALAMALLEDLSRKKALVAVSTHYNRLKTYGILDERAKNACVEFDESTSRPTFALQYGTPGSSYAFEIARECGIKADIIDHARRYLSKDEVHLNRLIDKLNRLNNEAAFERSEAEHVKRKYHSAKERLKGTLDRLESEKTSILEQKAAEADQVIKEARDQLKDIINTFKRKGESSQAFIQQRFDDISNKLLDRISVSEDRGKPDKKSNLRAGQLVRHKGLGQEGRIISIDTSSSKALILTGNIKVSVNMQDLLAIADKEEHKSEKSPGDISCQVSSNSGREINLIGYRVDDALPLIDKMIDRTMIEGELSLRIVHGYGTGRLRSAIRDHLKSFSCVKRVCGADLKSGGEAITIVELN